MNLRDVGEEILNVHDGRACQQRNGKLQSGFLNVDLGQGIATVVDSD